MSEPVPKILVIDDNPKNLDLLSALLDKQGLVMLFALDGARGIQRAESGQPDLILLDIMMPHLDGFETCRQLKANEKTKDIPVIFMTALADTANKVKGFELGAVDYLTKPIQPEEVVARVNTHLKIQRLQQNLKQALEHERELNKLKTRFVSVASHELRTPLTQILYASNFLEELGDQLSAEQKVQQFATIERAVNQMADILNDILILSRQETGKFEFSPKTTDVRDFCHRLVQEFQLISEKTHTMIFASPDDPVQAVVDPNVLQVILSNLLSNAIKYSPAGGTIHVQLQHAPEALIFSIKDEGLGISPEDQRHLFEAFHRGNNVGKLSGTGLGLSIVKQFVDLHGGAIRVDSAVNKGATFTVTIPIGATTPLHS